MLVLTRRIDESLIIQNNIILTVLAIDGDKVKLGIQAPPEVPILREELRGVPPRPHLTAAQLATAQKTHPLAEGLGRGEKSLVKPSRR